MHPGDWLRGSWEVEGLTDPYKSQMSSTVLLLLIHMERNAKSCSLAGFALKLVKFIREDSTHLKRRSRNNTVLKREISFWRVCQYVHPLVLFSPSNYPQFLKRRGKRQPVFTMSQLCGKTCKRLQVLRMQMQYSYRFH